MTKEEKDIRKQVCDEIREKLKGKERLMLYKSIYEEGYFVNSVKEILDQVEQGECR